MELWYRCILVKRNQEYLPAVGIIVSIHFGIYILVESAQKFLDILLLTLREKCLYKQILLLRFAVIGIIIRHPRVKFLIGLLHQRHILSTLLVALKSRLVDMLAYLLCDLLIGLSEKLLDSLGNTVAQQRHLES